MNTEKATGLHLHYKPLCKERWKDFEKLFGKHGAYGGCWCMWWRIKRSEFSRNQGEGNKKAMRQIVESGTIPGILAYDGEEPVAWCSVAPREQFPVIYRSWVLKPVDDQPVWSIVCFFVAQEFRGTGMSRALIRAAVAYARENGAGIVEAYPTDKKHTGNTAFEGYTGFLSSYIKEGFKEVARRSPGRPIVRL